MPMGSMRSFSNKFDFDVISGTLVLSNRVEKPYGEKTPLIGRERPYAVSGEDSYKEQPGGDASWVIAGLLLVNAALGAGLLNYPVAYDRLGGIAVATCIQVIMLLILATTMYILVYCAYKNNVTSYHEVLECMCGHTVRQISAFSILITCFGICVTFLIIIGDQFDRIFATFYGQKFCYNWYLNRIFTIVFTSVITIWPMSYCRRLDFLKYANLLGIFATLYVIFLNVYEYYKLDVTPGPIKTYPDHPLSILGALPVVCFAYQTHEIVVPVYSCLSDRNPRNFLKSTTLSLSLLFILYCVSGTYGYLTFGSIVAPDIMLMYDPNDPIVSAGIIALIVKMITTYPPVIFAGRDTIMGLFCKGPEPIPIDQRPENKEFRNRIIITSAWNIMALILAILIPNISVAIGFLGSLAACNVFVFPGLCMTSLARRKRRSVSHRPFISRALFSYGVFIIITGVLMFLIILYQVIHGLSDDYNHELLCH